MSDRTLSCSSPLSLPHLGHHAWLGGCAGLVLLGRFCCHEWLWALPLSVCPCLRLGPGWVSRRLWPWHFCHPLATHSSLVLLCPSGPSCHVPMPWALNKAASHIPGSFPILSLQIFHFSQPCSSAVRTCPHAGGIGLCQWAQGLQSRCIDVAAAHQAWLSVFTCLPSAQGPLSFTASLAVPDQTSLSHLSPDNTCSCLSSVSTPESLIGHFCPQNRCSQD